MNETSQRERWSLLPFLGFALLLLALGAVPRVFEDIKRDDPERNIVLPENLLHELQVKVAYNEEEIFFRFRLPTDAPIYYHDYRIYEEDGTWRREGYSQPGPEPHGVYEDRVTFFVDDGAVPDFARYGGFITVSGKQMRFFTDAAGPEDLEAHPHFQGRGLMDVQKFLPETREDPADWRSVKSPEELRALQEAGYFLDLWHWRSHRAHPVGYSDSQYILDYRLGDEGRGPFFFNWDAEANQPRYMFDPEKTGQVAMRWERVLEYDYPFTEPQTWALIEGNDELEGNLLPFDPDLEWRAGDVLPNRVVRVPTGSRGDIRASATYEGGAWNVDLWRALDTGNPLDDKQFQHGGLYHTAFAAHINATGSRWHYVSFPFSLGLGREAEIQAHRFSGETPPWEEIDWFSMQLFYPGQIDWAHVASHAHAGYEQMQEGASLRQGHDERVLAHYAVESEFREEITRRWWLSALATVLLVLLIGLGGALYYRPRAAAFEEVG